MKILFKLNVNSNGFPPIEYELLNADPVSGHVFRIKNAPFFAPDISYGDLVEARTGEVADQFVFVRLIEASDFTSISIIILDATMDTFLMDLLRGLNCVVEYGEFGVYRVLAVAVPADTDYQNVRKQLEILEGQLKISFAELAVAKNS